MVYYGHSGVCVRALCVRVLLHKNPLELNHLSSWGEEEEEVNGDYRRRESRVWRRGGQRIYK